MFRSKRADAAPASPDQSRNLAARMGRWSACHWKTATFGWLALVVVAFALGGAIGTKTIDPNTSGPGESGRVDRILDAGFKQPAGRERPDPERLASTPSDPAFKAAIEDVVAGISKLDAVQNVRSPLDPANAGQIAPNGHAALVEFEIRGEADKAIDKIEPVLDRVDELQQSPPAVLHRRVRRRELGQRDRYSRPPTTSSKAGLFSLPITLIILVVAFGALVAAGIPLLLALTAVFATFGLSRCPASCCR